MSRPKNKTVPVAPPQNLRLEAAAGMLGVSLPSFRNLVSRGDCKVIRLGPRSVRVPLSEVERIMRGGA